MDPIMEKQKIMDAQGVKRTLTRMAHELLERNKGIKNMALVGIRTKGYFLALRLAAEIKEIEKYDIPVGALDVTFYRDDTSRMTKEVQKTEIPFDVKDQRIILVDDVLYTGRSTRAALDALIDLGRPKVIQLAVLVDRGHRELPIRADYAGKNIPTAGNQEVKVILTEAGDEEDGVILINGEK